MVIIIVEQLSHFGPLASTIKETGSWERKAARAPQGISGEREGHWLLGRAPAWGRARGFKTGYLIHEC